MCVYVRYSSTLQQELLETTLATQTKEAYILFAGLLNCPVYLQPTCYGSFSTLAG